MSFFSMAGSGVYDLVPKAGSSTGRLVHGAATMGLSVERALSSRSGLTEVELGLR